MKIKQATKQGYIEVRPGGGIRLFIPKFKDKERQSDR